MLFVVDESLTLDMIISLVENGDEIQLDRATINIFQFGSRLEEEDRNLDFFVKQNENIIIFSKS
jgi:hypothetical protein